MPLELEQKNNSEALNKPEIKKSAHLTVEEIKNKVVALEQEISENPEKISKENSHLLESSLMSLGETNTETKLKASEIVNKFADRLKTLGNSFGGKLKTLLLAPILLGTLTSNAQQGPANGSSIDSHSKSKIPTAQASKEQIFVSSVNDPRYIAYNDSLQLYATYEKNKADLLKNNFKIEKTVLTPDLVSPNEENITNANTNKIVYDKKNPDKATYDINFSAPNSGDTVFTTKEHVLNASNESEKYIHTATLHSAMNLKINPEALEVYTPKNTLLKEVVPEKSYLEKLYGKIIKEAPSAENNLQLSDVIINKYKKPTQQVVAITDPAVQLSVPKPPERVTPKKQEQSSLVVHDKNDPRLIAYRDSLNLNKLGKKFIKEIRPTIAFKDIDVIATGPSKDFNKQDIINEVDGLKDYMEYTSDPEYKKIVDQMVNLSDKSGILPTGYYPIKGTAPAFKKPTQKVVYEPFIEDTVKKQDPKKIETVKKTQDHTQEYSATDGQVKFIVGSDGKTKTPYIERNYYSKTTNKLVATEKLNPETLEPLK